MENRELLSEAEAKFAAFDKESEPERLREAGDCLAAVVLAAETTPAMRLATLAKWLQLLQIVDSRLDPKFDPEDVPASTAMPPGNLGLAPGVDPAAIADPKLRAEYEREIAATRKKAVDYRMQSGLHDLDARLTPRVEAFLRDNFLWTIEDRAAAIAAIEKTIVNSDRKQALFKQVPLP